MKRIAISALLLFSISAFAANKAEAPIVKGPKVAARASWRILSWPFRPQHPKPAKKADGSGPIQTCRPGTNCDPVV